MTDNSLPLKNLRVIELSHMVMGPSMGLILGDMGADVVKIEPLGGDKTRRLGGSGAGYFTMYNRNKLSICVDLKTERGKDVVRRLTAKADVLIENFRGGAIDKLGLGYEAMAELNPRLVYCSARGFLSGPYQHRTALDEVAQMMGGLAYMTGPPGQPLRAGASVIDVVGGMFGVIAILGALQRRQTSGRGGNVTAGLFESTAFLVGQHMAQYAVTGEPARPMPVRLSAWAIYEIFDTADDEKIFLAVVSDGQWTTFCNAFGFDELRRDTDLAENAGRVAARDRIIPLVRSRFKKLTASALVDEFERCGLPYARVARPEDLFDDPHLNAAGGLLDVHVPGGAATRLPALAIELDDWRPGVRRDVPLPGQDYRDVLISGGFSETEIESLVDDGIVEKPVGTAAGLRD